MSDKTLDLCNFKVENFREVKTATTVWQQKTGKPAVGRQFKEAAVHCPGWGK